MNKKAHGVWYESKYKLNLIAILQRYCICLYMLYICGR